MFFIPFGTRENKFKQRFHAITLLFFLLNVVVFVYQLVLVATGGGSALAGFIQKFAVIPADITDGSFLEISLITSMFLHGGLLHIVGNMLYFLPFGDNVEDRLGHVKYLFFYLICGVAGTLAYVYFNPDSTIPLLGASGAIAGVLGGYLALHPTGTVKGIAFFIIFLTRIDLPAIFFIGYWFFIQVFSSIASLGSAREETGGVAFMAHVGGFIAGLVLAPLLAATARKSEPEAD